MVKPMTREFVMKTCAPEGGGPATCSFLLMGADGWHCAKEEAGLRAEIERRRAAKAIRAMGDNCSGPPVFTIIEPKGAES